MKQLMEIRNLILVVLFVGVLLAVAPVQTANAGIYVWDIFNLELMSPEVEDGNSTESSSWSEEGDAYTFQYLTHYYGECSAWARTITGCWGGASAFASVSMDSWAYYIGWWEWDGEPNETAPGGNIDYDYTFSGYFTILGYSASYAGSAVAAAISEGTGYASASPGDTDSVSGRISGSVSNNNMGSAGGYVSPSEAIDEWSTSTDQGSFKAEVSWYLYVEDEEDVEEGTTYISFTVCASCGVDAVGSVSSTTQGWGTTYNYSSVFSAVSGNADFTSN
ncbi:MAG: hypothetical protein ACFFCW_31740 [Candidatus Hodarchaeota archaeon]